MDSQMQTNQTGAKLAYKQRKILLRREKTNARRSPRSWRATNKNHHGRLIPIQRSNIQNHGLALERTQKTPHKRQRNRTKLVHRTPKQRNQTTNKMILHIPKLRRRNRLLQPLVPSLEPEHTILYLALFTSRL